MTAPTADGTALPNNNVLEKAVAITLNNQTPSGVFIQEVSKCHMYIMFNLNHVTYKNITTGGNRTHDLSYTVRRCNQGATGRLVVR